MNDSSKEVSTRRRLQRSSTTAGLPNDDLNLINGSMPAKAPPKRQKADAFFVGKLDMNSPATLAKFKSASKAYTLKAIKSKATALETLRKEGLVTKSGKLAKAYAASKI